MGVHLRGISHVFHMIVGLLRIYKYIWLSFFYSEEPLQPTFVSSLLDSIVLKSSSQVIGTIPLKGGNFFYITLLNDEKWLKNCCKYFLAFIKTHLFTPYPTMEYDFPDPVWP